MVSSGSSSRYAPPSVLTIKRQVSPGVTRIEYRGETFLSRHSGHPSGGATITVLASNPFISETAEFTVSLSVLSFTGPPYQFGHSAGLKQRAPVVDGSSGVDVVTVYGPINRSAPWQYDTSRDAKSADLDRS